MTGQRVPIGPQRIVRFLRRETVEQRAAGISQSELYAEVAEEERTDVAARVLRQLGAGNFTTR